MYANAAHRRSQQGFTLIELMIVVAIVGILAAIVFPTFVNFQTRSRQAEVRSNLGAIYLSEISYFADNQRYGSFIEIGYTVSATTNRYTYRSPPTGGNGVNGDVQGVDVFATGAGQATVGGTRISQAGSFIAAAAVIGGLAPPSFSAAATGNLDADATTDEWHVNDLKDGLFAADQNDVTS